MSIAAAEKFLTVPQAADLFGVKTGTIYRAINDGSLHAVRLGRYVRIPESAIARFVERGGERHIPRWSELAGK